MHRFASAALSFLIAAALHAAPSAVFIHRVTSANVSGHITWLDHPAVNGQPSARIVVMPNWNANCGTSGTYVNSPQGVYYSGGRWAIFNERTSVAMPVGATFNVKVYAADAPDAFVHTATSSTVSANHSLTSLSLANAKSMVVTPGWSGMYLTQPVGVFAQSVGSDPTGRWHVALQDAAAAMPVGATFNIATGGSPHLASSSSVVGNTTYPYASIGDPYNHVFAGVNPYPTWGPGVLHNHPVGVWWNNSMKRWGIFNEDMALMPTGVRFTVQFHRRLRAAFVSDRDGSQKIWTTSYEGDCTQRVTTGTLVDRMPVLSPNGLQIVFKRRSYTPYSRWDLYVTNIDGTGFTRLLTPIDPSAYHDFTRAAWSPDGTLIAYVANSDLGPASLPEDGLHVVRYDGTGNRLLSTRLGSGNASPRFSPNGTRLVYDAYYPRMNSDIYTINVDGTGETNLTNSADDERDPVYAPSGAQIAYASRLNGSTFYSIKTMTATGGSIVNLTPGWVRHNRYPFYSPDGTTIAFLSYQASDSMTSAELWLMNADGSIQRRLVEAVDVESNGGVAFIATTPPVFTPDGRAIVYASGGEIYRINVDGGSLTNLSNAMGLEAEPDIR